VLPAEPQDWRPLLDQELSRLPPKYRAVVVLCELEGRPRREAARLLDVPEGTLSSRLAAAHRILARRLVRRGLLPAGALAALFEGVAPAAVPAALQEATVRSASLVAAGLEVAVTAPVFLMKGVLQTMFLLKLKCAVAAVLVVAALGAGGLAYQAGRPAAAQAGEPGGKPRNELEALRRENELLKLNLEVVLEKVRALQTQLAASKGREKTASERVLKEMRAKAEAQRQQARSALEAVARELQARQYRTLLEAARAARAARARAKADAKGEAPGRESRATADRIHELEAALQALRDARDTEARRRAADALEKAMLKLRKQLPAPPRPDPTRKNLFGPKK
jgi:hypothetical protein